MLIHDPETDRNHNRDPGRDAATRINTRRILALLVVYGLIGLALLA